MKSYLIPYLNIENKNLLNHSSLVKFFLLSQNYFLSTEIFLCDTIYKNSRKIEADFLCECFLYICLIPSTSAVRKQLNDL